MMTVPRLVAEVIREPANVMKALPIWLISSGASRKLRVQLLFSLRQEARQCQPDGLLPGRSEILDSAIGQYKHTQ
jgi:hypothetical protein